jgi:hypothetical protein
MTEHNRRLVALLPPFLKTEVETSSFPRFELG